MSDRLGVGQLVSPLESPFQPGVVHPGSHGPVPGEVEPESDAEPDRHLVGRIAEFRDVGGRRGLVSVVHRNGRSAGRPRGEAGEGGPAVEIERDPLPPDRRRRGNAPVHERFCRLPFRLRFRFNRRGRLRRFGHRRLRYRLRLRRSRFPDPGSKVQRVRRDFFGSGFRDSFHDGRRRFRQLVVGIVQDKECPHPDSYGGHRRQGDGQGVGGRRAGSGRRRRRGRCGSGCGCRGTSGSRRRDQLVKLGAQTAPQPRRNLFLRALHHRPEQPVKLCEFVFQHLYLFFIQSCSTTRAL